MVITELEMKLCDWSNLKEEQIEHAAVIIASLVVCQLVEEGDSKLVDTETVEQCVRDISVTHISLVHSGQHFS
jgi:hypothetical protein